MEKQKSVLASAFTGTIYLFLLQLFSRGITFFLNQILLRFTSAKVLGIVNIKLELILETILFISREGIRMALLRSKSNNDSKKEEKEKKEKKQLKINSNEVTPEALVPIQKAINLSYIPIIIGFALTVFVSYYFNKQQTTQNENSSSIFLYSIAALIELFSEPLYILSQYHMLFNIRVKAEGLAVFVRCIASFILTIYINYVGMEVKSSSSVLCFAWAQLFYSVTLLGVYVYSFWIKCRSIKPKEEDLDVESLHLKQGIKAFLPALIKEKKDTGNIEVFYFDDTLLSLSITLYVQSFIKYLLTQGDKIILNLLCSDVVQGVYAFVTNYGSLILRIVFQPLEETCRIYFSKELVSKESTPSSRKQVRQVILTLLKCHSILGMYFIFFGTNYTGVLIDLLAGSKWSRESLAPKALAYYCFSIPFMGFNGILEGFVQAVAPKKELYYQSKLMTLYWIVFAALCFIFVRFLKMEVVGIILANIINMLLRIISCYKYLFGYFKAYEKENTEKTSLEMNPLNAISNNKIVWTSFILSWILCKVLGEVIGWYTLKQKAIFVFFGATCALLCTLILFKKEKSLIEQFIMYNRMLKA